MPTASKKKLGRQESVRKCPTFISCDTLPIANLLALKPYDGESGGKLLIVGQIKGEQNRLFPLIEKLIDHLRGYLKTFRLCNSKKSTAKKIKLA